MKTSKQLFVITRAPEAVPINENRLVNLLEHDRPDSEWAVRQLPTQEGRGEKSCDEPNYKYFPDEHPKSQPATPTQEGRMSQENLNHLADDVRKFIESFVLFNSHATTDEICNVIREWKPIPPDKMDKKNDNFVSCCGKQHKIIQWRYKGPCQYGAECSVCGKRLADDTPALLQSAWRGKGNEKNLCKWKWDTDGFWHTDCGSSFMLNDGTPKENDCNFCHKCGKQITCREQGKG